MSNVHLGILLDPFRPILSFTVFLSTFCIVLRAHVSAQPDRMLTPEFEQHFQRVKDKLKQEDRMGAIEECKNLVDDAKDDPDVRIMAEKLAGDLHLSLDRNKALKHYLSCLEMLSHSREREMQWFTLRVLRDAADCYRELGEFGKAREFLRKVVTDYPYEHDVADALLGGVVRSAVSGTVSCLMKEGKEDEIPDYCERIFAEHRDHGVGAEALDKLANYYKRLGELDLANETFTRLIELYPNDPLVIAAAKRLGDFGKRNLVPPLVGEDELPEEFARGLVMLDSLGKHPSQDVRLRGFICAAAGYTMATNIKRSISRKTWSREFAVVSASGLSPKVRFLGQDPVTKVAVTHIRGEALPYKAFAKDFQFHEGQSVKLVWLEGFRPTPKYRIKDCIVTNPNMRIRLRYSPIHAPRLVAVKPEFGTLGRRDYYGAIAVNTDGAVVGLCVDAWGDSTALLAPVTWLTKVMNAIAKTGKYPWPYLGIRLRNILIPGEEPKCKVVVDKVDPNGPAATSVKVNDRIMALDGVSIPDSGVFHSMISAREAGAYVKLTMQRAAAITEVSVKLAQLDASVAPQSD